MDDHLKTQFPSRFEAARMSISRGVLKRVKLDKILAALTEHEMEMNREANHQGRFVSAHKDEDGDEFLVMTDREQFKTAAYFPEEGPDM